MILHKMTIIEAMEVKRSVSFACGFCPSIKTVNLDRPRADGEENTDHLPDGWSILTTSVFLDQRNHQLICDKHEVKVERPVEKKHGK